MTFKEAYEKAVKLAGDKPCSVSYGHMKYSSGNDEVTCRVWIDGYGCFMQPTFEWAFKELDQVMYPPTPSPEPEGDL